MPDSAGRGKGSAFGDSTSIGCLLWWLLCDRSATYHIKGNLRGLLWWWIFFIKFSPQTSIFMLFDNTYPSGHLPFNLRPTLPLHEPVKALNISPWLSNQCHCSVCEFAKLLHFETAPASRPWPTSTCASYAIGANASVLRVLFLNCLNNYSERVFIILLVWTTGHRFQRFQMSSVFF